MPPPHRNVPEEDACLADDLATAAISPNTRLAYASALKGLDRALNGERPTDASLAAHLERLFRRGRAPATAKLTVAAVRFRAREEGAADPVGPRTRKALDGFRRQGVGRGRGQVDGISWEQADGMAERAAGDGTLAGLRDAAIVAVGSACMLRVSEISALDVSDVLFRNNGAAFVTIRRSKTDQHGRGHVEYVGARLATFLRNWIAAAGLAEGALFRRVGRSGRPWNDRLQPQSVRTAIVRRARQAGIPGHISGHSLRVGSAQSLYLAGGNLLDVMRAGRWKSSRMAEHYTRLPSAMQGPMARLRFGVREE